MTMDADAVITAYVADVAARLPRRRRGDVAFELQALLAEELQGVAAAEGRAPDAPMALALVRAFGEPAEVADRYRTPLTVIDAADGRRFVVASVVGLVLIWIAGFASVLRDAPGLDTLSLLGRWWVGTVIPSPWWPGVLVLWFGAAAWGRRRGPRASAWTPRAPDAINGGRAAIALGLVGMLAGIGILLQPARVLDLFWPGTAAPAAVAALTYSAEFVALRGPVLLALVAANVPIALVVLVSGRRPAWLRRAEVVLSAATCAAMVWAIAGGPILATGFADRTAKGAMALIVLVIAACALWLWWRRVRPAAAATPRPANNLL